jgi:hypothetical protein
MIEHAPTTVQAGERFEIPVRLTNLSPHILHSLGQYPIYWSYHWLDVQGQVIVRSGDRTRLFPPALPARAGKIADLNVPYYVKIMAPNQAGQSLLKLTLVQEQVRWFDQSPIDFHPTRSITVL